MIGKGKTLHINDTISLYFEHSKSYGKEYIALWDDSSVSTILLGKFFDDEPHKRKKYVLEDTTGVRRAIRFICEVTSLKDAEEIVNEIQRKGEEDVPDRERTS